MSLSSSASPSQTLRRWRHIAVDHKRLSLSGWLLRGRAPIVRSGQCRRCGCWQGRLWCVGGWDTRCCTRGRRGCRGRRCPRCPRCPRGPRYPRCPHIRRRLGLGSSRIAAVRSVGGFERCEEGRPTGQTNGGEQGVTKTCREGEWSAGGCGYSTLTTLKAEHKLHKVRTDLRGCQRRVCTTFSRT